MTANSIIDSLPTNDKDMLKKLLVTMDDRPELSEVKAILIEMIKTSS